MPQSKQDLDSDHSSPEVKKKQRESAKTVNG